MASKKPKMETMGFSKTLGKYVCVAQRNFPFWDLFFKWICPRRMLLMAVNLVDLVDLVDLVELEWSFICGFIISFSF